MTMFRCSWARGITDAVIMQFSPLSLRGALCDEELFLRFAPESRYCFRECEMTDLKLAVLAEEPLLSVSWRGRRSNPDSRRRPDERLLRRKALLAMTKARTA